ncbi:hypothetical protein ACFWHQ_41345 [Streptomyces sp. NPDC060334]|uniref:hypothetical protein n=1 Tax=unclassified Streptomyces TaxID=2593676 RepID=UPI0033316053
MLKRFIVALSVAAAALLLPIAGGSQPADTTVSATGESEATTAPAHPVHVTPGTTTGGTRLSDPKDSSWGS